MLFRGDGPKQALAIVSVLAFCTLMFELIVSRMSVFYLNYANSFAAIPLTLFGLAVGSLRVHLGKKKPEELDVHRDLLVFVGVCFLAFVVTFLVFSSFFHISYRGNLASTQELLKTLIFVAIFLPPFFFVGKILTTLYARHRDMIGRLYGVDLLGAAMACFATPFLFHFIDLPYLIATTLVVLSGLCVVLIERARWVLLGVLVLANAAALPTLIHLESSYDLAKVLGGRRDRVEEVMHRWNEYSRVSLLRVEDKHGKLRRYQIVHDNAESNVHVRPYAPDRKATLDRNVLVAKELGRPTNDVLVMFAGCGAQMIEFDKAGMGHDKLVGVELNPLVLDFALEAPELERYRLAEFFNLPYVDMVRMEGRRYLDSHPDQFDVIYVANNAATSQYKSGHSRKYLDTREAMTGYLDHLSDNGLMVFRCQPLEHHIASLHSLFEERNIGPLDERAIVVARGWCRDMIVSPTAFSRDEIRAVDKLYGKRVLYEPFGASNKHWASLLSAKHVDPDEIVTDDRPYIERLNLAEFNVLPSAKQLHDRTYYRGWIKVFTALMACVVVGLLVGGLYVTRKRTMPPLGMLVYLLITGFCYMLVEIAFIGKLDLFLENPLYSMALLLSLFLLTNALGSALYGKLGPRLPMTWMPIAVACVALGSLIAMNAVITQRLGLPLWLKVLVTALLLAPTGVGLGFFFPYVVTWLDKHGHTHAIPVTYALSTLSSVAGATYAMTFVINVGYAALVYQAAAGYVLLTVLTLLITRLTRAPA